MQRKAWPLTQLCKVTERLSSVQEKGIRAGFQEKMTEESKLAR